MTRLHSKADPNGLLEYSVVYTDRALNHMSQKFQDVMNDITRTLKSVYAAHAAVVIPGSGTFGMEAVARQLATNKHCLVVRNGWFSYRWSQIFELGNIPKKTTVLKAQAQGSGPQAPWAPPAIETLVQTIEAEKPDLVFMPHVETASGIMLPDDYIRQAADAVHRHGGLLVLDSIASGTIWVDMQKTGVDVLISAPQKGWTASACCALVMLSPRGEEAVQSTQSSSFACDLKKWLSIAQTYEAGSHAYHATMPTDSLVVLRNAMVESATIGFDTLYKAQLELGQQIRQLLKSYGFKSVAAKGFEAPGVVVSYTVDDGIHSASKLAEAGVQAASGVPLQCDEPDDFKTFRLGLFGLDKLLNIERTVERLEQALKKIS